MENKKPKKQLNEKDIFKEINNAMEYSMGDDPDYIDRPYNQGLSDEQFKENMEYLENHPFSLKKMPQNIEDNELLQTLQAMKWDDDRDKMAQHHLQEGNNYFRKHKNTLGVKKAMENWSIGIAYYSKDLKVNTKLYSNRSLLYFNQKNFGRSITDCKDCIKCDKTFVKPYYRMGQCYMKLERYKDAFDILKEGLKFATKKKQKKEMTKMFQDAAQKHKEKTDKLVNEMAKRSEENYYFQNQINKREIALGQLAFQIPQKYNDKIFFDKEGILKTPIIIEYPQFQQMDFIQAAAEHDILFDHINQIFSQGILPWDSEKHYTLDNIEVFLELQVLKRPDKPYKKKVKNLGDEPVYKQIDIQKTTVLALLQTQNYVVPGIPQLTLISRSSPYFKVFISRYKIIGK